MNIAQINLGDAGLAGLRFKIDKLNKRANRYGMNRLELRIVDAEPVVDNGIEYPRYDVTIIGVAPCIDGWYLAARIENHEIIGKLVRIVPGPFADDDYSEFRDHDFGCDHCRTHRRRNDVFVLKNEDGNVKVVGRNCLADYLRCDNAEDFARYAQFCDECANWDDASLSECAYEEGFGGRGGPQSVAIKSFLAVVNCCIRRLGWISRTAAMDGGATADDAMFVIFGNPKDSKAFITKNELYVSDDDKDIASIVVEWAKALEPDKSEYLDVISKIAIAGATDSKLAGYAASMIRAYQRDQEWKAERAERAANAPEKVFIGSIGERLKGLTVTVKRVRYCEGSYGVSTIVAMETKIEDGVIAPLVWFASGSKEFNEDTEYTLTGTVKKHDEGKYGKQTKINRCRLDKLVSRASV
jgi:hypothetical protein